MISPIQCGIRLLAFCIFANGISFGQIDQSQSKPQITIQTDQRGLPSAVFDWESSRMAVASEESYGFIGKSPIPFTGLAVGWRASDSMAKPHDFLMEIRTKGTAKTWSIIRTHGETAPQETPSGLYWSHLHTTPDGDLHTEYEIRIKAPNSVALETVRISVSDASAGLKVDRFLGQSASPKNAQTAGAFPQPSIIPRSEWWGSQPASEINSPRWMPVAIAISHAVIHHTVHPNNSANPAQIVRQIWDHHANNNGWGDIGYNFLVDHLGNIYQGRYNPWLSSTDVRAAHAGGGGGDANAVSFGVALIGQFHPALSTPPAGTPGSPSLRSVENLIAWRFDQRNLDPLGNANITTYWGTQNLGRITGHRNIGVLSGATECPGDNLYDQLSAIRTNVKDLLNPTVVDVTYHTLPPGLQILVDGVVHTTPKTFQWNVGSPHVVTATSPQVGSNDTQYLFSSWSNGQSQTHVIQPPNNKTTYTASFTTQYFLTMNPNSGGTVAPSSGWHNLGQNVSITATPATGYAFSSWSGSGSGSYTGSNNPASITMNGPITQTASFAPNVITRTLTVASSNPTSGVNITVSPDDNNGQGNGTTQFTRIYEQGKPVTLTAPAQVGGNNFQKWLSNGADWTTGQAATVIMDDNHTMTAVYAAAPPQPTHTLTITSSNPNSGVIVTVTPNDNNGQGNGTTQFTRTYNYNTQVRLEVPFTASGGKFQQWLRDGEFWSNSQITFVTMNDDYTITAVYSPSPEAFKEVPNAFQNTGCGRISWGDYDNDQDLDVLLTGSDSSNIYQNDNGKFSLAPISLIGVSGSSSASHAWGDYDNDGDLDILLTGRSNSGLISKLYRNDAKGFEEVSISLEDVWYGSVAWGDYDNDGDLDILLTGQSFAVAPYINIARIYRNDGDDVFRNIAVPLEGVANSSVAWGDYDKDGYLDIALIGSGMSFSTVSRIYKNENGIFEDILAPLTPVTAGSVAWGDYDNDGDLDLLLTGHEIPGPIIELYENGNGKFEKVTTSMAGVYNSSAAWGDYDNDGDLDVLLSGTDSSSVHISRVYQNDGENFSEVPLSLPGLYFSSAAWGDYDNDGDLDFLLSGRTASDDRVTKLYLNNVTKPNTVPAVPTGLNASVSGNAATFNWNKSTDNQTAQNALTYNLRIGKTPVGTQIVSPMASVATGYRKVPQLGNTNHRNSWTIKELSPGTYYWSVQAIDNAFAGSTFAPEQNFTIAPAQTIEVTAPPAGATWTAGSKQSVNWTSSGVTGKVNIKLSTDSGITFPDTLAANIVNDSSQVITVPDTASSTCRIRVELVSDSGVFGLNPGDFSIIQCHSFELKVNNKEWGTASTRTEQNCSGGYTSGTQMSLTATPASNYKFVKWTGSGGLFEDSLASSTTFTITGAAVVTANFEIDTGVSEKHVALPLAHHLKQNYPNPFNPGTAISFTLPKAGEVTLTIYSTAGQLIRQVTTGNFAAGEHRVNWDGRNSAGEQVAAGIYLYRLVVHDAAGAVTFTETKRMALLK